MEADNLKEIENLIEKQPYHLESAGLKVKVTITASTVEIMIESPNSVNPKDTSLKDPGNPGNPPNPKETTLKDSGNPGNPPNPKKLGEQGNAIILESDESL